MSKEIEVKGFVDPKFDAIKDVFKANFRDFKEVGASFAVFLKDRFVVDIWDNMQIPKKLNHGRVNR